MATDLTANCTIRAASFADIGLLAHLNADIQELHSREVPWIFKASVDVKDVAEVFRATLSDMAFFCRIAEVDGTAAGYVVAEFWQKEETELKYPHSMVYLHQIGVAAAVRRRGIGSALINAVLEEAKVSEVQAIAVDVWSFNDGARDFFRKCGLGIQSEKMWLRLE